MWNVKLCGGLMLNGFFSGRPFEFGRETYKSNPVKAYWLLKCPEMIDVQIVRGALLLEVTDGAHLGYRVAPYAFETSVILA